MARPLCTSTTVATWTLLFSFLLTARITSNQVSAQALVLEDDWIEDLDGNSDHDDDGLSLMTTPLHDPNAVDFRDLFLPPAEAINAGGTGLEPYGNLFSTYFIPNMEGLMKPEPTTADESGTDILNTQVIEPFTEAQSGTIGDLLYTDLLDLSLLGGRMQVTLSNLRISNLNTVLPVELFQPTTAPHVLTNEFQMGNEGEEVEVIVRLGIWINGTSGTMGDELNEVDIRFTVPSATFRLDLVVLVDEMKLRQLPLREILNPGCWMDTLMYTDMAEEDLLETFHRALNLQTFKATLASLSMNVTCVSCSSAMEALVPRLMASLQSGIESSATTARTTQNDKSILTTQVEALLEDAVWNVWDIVDLQSVIREAATLCPNNPNYEPTNSNNTAAAAADFVNFNATTDATNFQPELSRSSFESLLAAGFVGAQTGIVLAAHQYLTMEPTPSQDLPVFGVHLNMTETRTYVDWRDLGVFDTVRDYLNPDTVNNLIRDSGFLDNNTGAFAVPFLSNISLDTSLGYLVSVDAVSVVGMDSLTILNILDPVGPYELETEVQWENLFIQANLSFTTTTNTRGRRSSFESEHMSVSMQLHDIRMFLGMILPIDLDQLGELQLGAILQGLENTLPCLMASSKNTSIQTLNVTVGRMENPSVEGFLSSDLRSMVNSMSTNLFQDFGQDIVTAVPNMFQTTIRELINDLLLDQYKALDDDPTVCLADITFSKGGFVDFRDLLLGADISPYGTYFQAAYTYLRENIFTAEGVANLNDRIALWTEDQSEVKGVLDFLENGFNATTAFLVGNLNGTARLNLWNVSLQNIDSLGVPFLLAYPTSGYVLQNNVSVGAGSKPLTLGANMLIAASDGEEMDIHNEIHLSLGFEQIAVFGKILLKMAEKALLTFPMKSVSNPYCWLALLPPTRSSEVSSETSNRSGLAIDASWGYDEAFLDLNCSSCTSPDLPELISRLYRTGESEYDAIEELANRVVNGDLVSTFLGRFINDAPELCPHSEEYSPEAAAKNPGFAAAAAEPLEEADVTARDRTSVFFNIGFASFAVAVLLAFIALKVITLCKNKTWKKSLSGKGDKLLRDVQDRERERDEYLDQSMASLYLSLFIPTPTRVLVPFFIVLNMGLFMVAHSATSIFVSLEVKLAGDEFMVHRMFEFNFADGLRNTYRNGGYEMAIMLLIFGGVWPYFKCLVSLVLWFTPPQRLSAAYRGRMLLWIDAMNKLTVRDIFKFLIIIAVIFIYVGGPYVFSQGVGDLYSMRLIAKPGPALYCGITAMIISRVSSRWLLDYHIQAMEAAQQAYHQDHIGVTKRDGMDTSGGSGGERLAERSAVGTFCESMDTSEGFGEPVASSSFRRGMSSSFRRGMSSSFRHGMSSSFRHGRSSSFRHSTRSSFRHDMDSNEMYHDHDLGASTIPLEITIEERRYISICGKKIIVGAFGIYLGVFTIFLVLIVGLIIIPAVAIDLSSIMELFLESGTTYDQAISEFGVYSFICAILLQASMVLESSSDYVAVGLLLLVGILITFFMVFLSTIRWIRDIYTKGWRQIYPLFFEKDSSVLTKLPAYLRLYAYKYFTIYVIAYVIGIFQLGTVTIYAIHYFCSILDGIYGALAFIGFIPETSGQCWGAQMSHMHNIVVFFGCFFYLTFIFITQLTIQYRLNVKQASELIRQQEEESAYFEKAWKEKSVKPFGSAVMSGLSGISGLSGVSGLSDKLTLTKKKSGGDNASAGGLGSKLTLSTLSEFDDDTVVSPARSRLHSMSTTMTGFDMDDSDDEEDTDSSCSNLANDKELPASASVISKDESSDSSCEQLPATAIESDMTVPDMDASVDDSSDCSCASDTVNENPATAEDQTERNLANDGAALIDHGSADIARTTSETSQGDCIVVIEV